MTPLDLTKLQSVAPEQYEQLKFSLNPSARLLTSTYPIQQIWQVNQDNNEEDQTVSLDQGDVQLLVIRPTTEIKIEVLSAGEFALLRSLADNTNFATACEQALETQADFDVTLGFQKHVMQGTLVDFSF